MHGFLSALRVGLISSPLPKRKGASRVPPPTPSLLSKMEGGSAGSHGGAPCHALACPRPFWPSLYSIRPLQSRRRLPFVNWSFASSPAYGRAVQCRDANPTRPRPPSSPSEAVAKPDHGSASHHGTERTDWLARRCLHGPGPVCGARLRLVRKRGRGDRRGVSQRVERSAVPLRCLRGRETQNRPI